MQLLGSQQELKLLADTIYAGWSVISKSIPDLLRKVLGLAFFSFFSFSRLSPIQMLEDSIHRYGELSA